MKPPFLARRSLAAALCGPLLLLTAATASASPTYPGLLEDYFELDDAPECTLCHKTNSGGYGTLNDVGDYLKSELSLKEKLDKTALEKILDEWDETQDTDEDDAPDIEELKAGTDPNDEESKPDEGEGGSGGNGGKGGDDGDGGTGGKEENGSGGKSGTGGSAGSSGLTGVATSAGCSFAGPPGGSATAGLALAAFAALLGRARAGRRRGPG